MAKTIQSGRGGGNPLAPGGLPGKWFRDGGSILICLAAAKLLLHIALSGRYGYFRDELYYLACGEHLAWGYVDQPPLVALAAKLSRAALGPSLFSIRLRPALAGALIVFLTGWLAREFGGGRFAQRLAALAILIAPGYLAFSSFLSMNAFEPLLWTLCAFLAIRIVKGGTPRLWLLFGAAAGIGLLNKHTMLLFGFAVVAGLLLTPARHHLRSPWIWMGGVLALVIFAPNLLWEARHGWPQIEVVRNAQLFKNSPISPARFVFEQLLFLHPIAAPIWFAGLLWLLFGEAGKQFRFLGWAFLIVLTAFIILHGKTYYALPAYPMLMAAGGVALERFAQLRPRWHLEPAYPLALIVAGLVTLPFGVPVLPVQAFLRYQEIVPMSKLVKTERDATSQLPQLYADMFGWEEMVKTVAGVYDKLSPEDRTGCAILTGNYGEAGAIDLFGAKYGLPKAISGHNSYFLWGSRGYTGEVVILFGDRAEILKGMFANVQQVATISNPYAMPVERDLPVYLCRKPRASLQQLWPSFKYYI